MEVGTLSAKECLRFSRAVSGLGPFVRALSRTISSFQSWGGAWALV